MTDTNGEVTGHGIDFCTLGMFIIGRCSNTLNRYSSHT
jgi:hypothetical protein